MKNSEIDDIKASHQTEIEQKVREAYNTGCLGEVLSKYPTPDSFPEDDVYKRELDNCSSKSYQYTY